MDPLTPSTVTGTPRSRCEGQTRPRSRTRRWPLGLSLSLCLICALGSTATAAGPGPAGKEQIGPSWDPDRPVWADADARMRVRGDRPDGASIHVAYADPERRWDASLRRELQGFEAEAFPTGEAPRKTIVDKPPHAWMEQLALPDIPIRWNEKTVEYLLYFRDDPKGQQLIAAWLNRMGRYEQRLRTILAEVGVPEDLVYVAMVESGFDPSARSSVGAAGMWQFMTQTGQVYGLNSEYWIDDRLDFERSAYAAATYLADLKTRFGTWELALAAYNAGYGLVVQTIRTNNTNNFWALLEIENALPRQTRNYVPKILAAAIVGHNRAAFGVTGKERPRLDLIEVKIPQGTRIADLAKALDIDEDLLEEVNAIYLRGRVSPDQGPAPVRIPRDKHAAFEALGGALTPPPDQRWTTHSVKLGDDLDSISARYGITQKQLRKINGIHDSGEVRGGVILVVPTTSAPGSGTPVSAKPRLVAVPPLKVPSDSKLVFFRITRASSSVAIATAFSVAWQQVLAWNDLDPEARLVDGQMLQLLVPRSFDPAAAGVEVFEVSEVRYVIRGSAAHLDEVLDDRELARRGYKTRKGDNFKAIAKKFDLSVGSLARINGVSRSHKPSEGEVVIVYVAKDQTKGTVEAPDPPTTTLTAELEIAQQIDPSADPSADPSHGEPAGSGPRAPSTPERSRVPGKSYDDK